MPDGTPEPSTPSSRTPREGRVRCIFDPRDRDRRLAIQLGLAELDGEASQRPRSKKRLLEKKD